MPVSDLRQNPITAAFSFVDIDDEPHTVAELIPELPGIFGFVLEERPNPDPDTITFITDNTAAIEFTIIFSGAPISGEVRFDVARGMCIFFAGDVGTDFLVTYKGGGSNLTIAFMNSQITGNVDNGTVNKQVLGWNNSSNFHEIQNRALSPILIYDSGATQGLNVFSSISDLLTEAGTIVGGGKIVFKTNVTIPAGSFDFSAFELLGLGAEVTFPDNAIITGFPTKIEGLVVKVQSLVAGNGKRSVPAVTLLTLINGALESTGDVASFDTGSNIFVLNVDRASAVRTGTVAFIQKGGAGGLVKLRFFSQSVLETNALLGTNAIEVEHSDDTIVDETQGGTVNFTEFGGAPPGPSGIYLPAVYAEFSTVFSGSPPLLPNDNTIPQNTEALHITPLDLVVTPSAATNVIHFFAKITQSFNGNGESRFMIFQDAIVNALLTQGGGDTYDSAVNAIKGSSVYWRVTAGSTTTRTYKLFMGHSAAVLHTINGIGGAPFYNGTAFSSFMALEEII